MARDDAPSLYSRREFLRLAALGSASLYLFGCASPRRGSASEGTAPEASVDDFLRRFGPIDRERDLLGSPSPRVFSGDDFRRPHTILRDLPGYFAGKEIPPVDEEVPLVVVGGGLSGLFAAWRLRDHKPLILEQAPRFGGNARGESWSGADYALGSAYAVKPETGAPLDVFARELGLAELFRHHTAHDPVEIRGRLWSGFWDGAADPKERRRYRSLQTFLHTLGDTPGSPYPDIPAQGDARAAVDHWDQWDFATVLKKAAGGTIPLRLRLALERYCWSAHGAAPAEISAAAGLNFLAGETEGIWVAPGGNAAVSERLCRQLYGELGPERMRSNAIVVRVTVENGRAEVLYEDADQKLRRVACRAVVFAAPKFVASAIVPELEEARLEAIRTIPYRSYLVANVLLRTKPRPTLSDIYDVYLLGDAKTEVASAAPASEIQGATDVVLGTYARPQTDIAVLTLYRPFPFDGARGSLFVPEAYERYREALERQLTRQVLPALGYGKADVVDMRIARWGHPIPVAQPGFYRSKNVDTIRAPFRERVFFVEQDNWALPAIETAAAEALSGETDVRALFARENSVSS